mmetsp:Transcript_13607/g.31854  ORF Transcript_13607/g.31854 Transcript_13607/m.31854 type:complete len:212 (+) Transcript_13607:75-710(+)
MDQIFIKRRSSELLFLSPSGVGHPNYSLLLRLSSDDHRPGGELEDTVAEILQLLEHLARRPVELGRDRALRRHRQRRELLAQVAVRHILDGEEGRAEEHMVPAAEWRRLLTQVHLEMLEEVNVVSRAHREERADAAHICGVENHLVPGRREAFLLHRHHQFAHMELHHLIRLVCGAPQNAVGRRAHIIRLAISLSRKPHHKNIAEFVRACD